VIEIIVGVWLTSFVLSMFIVSFNYHLTRKRLNSESLKTLNFNLGKVDMYWSNSLANFAPLTQDAVEHDAAKTLRNTLYMGFLGLASLLGLVLLSVIVVSLHYLARSRKEIATFRGPLATNKNLSQSEVENFVREFNQIL
jgi:hypothetical protein